MPASATVSTQEPAAQAVGSTLELSIPSTIEPSLQAINDLNRNIADDTLAANLALSSNVNQHHSSDLNVPDLVMNAVLEDLNSARKEIADLQAQVLQGFKAAHSDSTRVEEELRKVREMFAQLLLVQSVSGCIVVGVVCIFCSS